MNVETIVKTLPPGSALFGRYSVKAGGEMETGLFIKEDLKKINNIPDSPDIHFKAVMFEDDDVIPVVVLAKVQGIVSPYDMWLNYHLKPVETYFENIISQESVSVHFYSVDKIERSVKVGNSLKEPFFQFKEKMAQSGSWTTAQFVSTFKKVSEEYPASENLWNFLDNPKGDQKVSNN